jgi:LCP family protein required for cell wall assembly
MVTTAIVISLGGVLGFQAYGNLHKVFNGGAATAAALEENVDPNLLKGEGAGRINILLMGRGGGTHSAPDLTDTMILASIDPVNHTQALISIPRDLWVTVPNRGAMKINAAWETGEFQYLGRVAPGSNNPQAIQAGFDEVDQVVENVLGVNIDYNILVNFQAFQQAVDTVGGVTVNVPTDLFDPTMAWENGGNPLLAAAGVDNFDGAQALRYVRSRETTSDFARAQRQRALLLALKAKVASLGTLSNPLKISHLMNDFSNNVKTDLTLKDASRLYGIVKSISDDQTKSIGLADEPTKFLTTGNLAGQSIALPKDGLFNYGAIQDFIRTQLPDGYLLKEQAPIIVLNGTDQVGLATTLGDKLTSYGYNVVGVANAPTNQYGHTIIVDRSHGKDKYTAHYLSQHFNTETTTGLPDTRIQPNGAAFVIIIGSDEIVTAPTAAN